MSDLSSLEMLTGVAAAVLMLGIGVALGVWRERRRTACSAGVEVDLQGMARSMDGVAGFTQDVAEDLHTFSELVSAMTDSMERDPERQSIETPDRSYRFLTDLRVLNELLRQRLERAERRLHEQALELKAYMSEARQDALTGLPNRRAFSEELSRRLAEASRYGHPLAVILFDIDHFKQINDRYGHAAGDAVLRELAGQFRSILRQSDMAARYGGEEFAIILPMSTVDGGVQTGERFRQALSGFSVAWEGVSIPVTVSGGVAQWQDSETAADLLVRADEALYAAKRGGRNAIAWHDGEQVTGPPQAAGDRATPERADRAEASGRDLVEHNRSFQQACDRLRRELEQLAERSSSTRRSSNGAGRRG